MFTPNTTHASGYFTALLLLQACLLLSCPDHCRADENPTPLQTTNYHIAALDNVVPEEVSLVVLEAYRRIGISASIVHYPGERALHISSKGMADAELARVASVGENYPDLLRVPVPIFAYQGVAFAKQQLPIRTWQDLAPYKVGVEVGVKFAEDGTRGLRVVTFTDRDKMFQLLEAGRLDVIVHLRFTGEAEIKRLGFTGIFALDPPLTNDFLYHFVNIKHAAIIPELTKALESVKKERKTP